MALFNRDYERVSIRNLKENDFSNIIFRVGKGELDDRFSSSTLCYGVFTAKPVDPTSLPNGFRAYDIRMNIYGKPNALCKNVKVSRYGTVITNAELMPIISDKVDYLPLFSFRYAPGPLSIFEQIGFAYNTIPKVIG